MSDTAGAPRTEPVERCPLCDSSRHRECFEQPDRLFGVPGRYRYRECGACATVFQSPRVVEDDLPRLYSGAYYTHEPPPLKGGRLDSTLRLARDALARRVRAAVRPGEGRPGPLGRLLARSVTLRQRAFRDRGLDELIPR